MTLSLGTKLGTYTVSAAIGKGGMGEVYRARDEKLERDVAIKVLPEAFARDRDRVARFEREAKLLATLVHQNVALIHGFEEADGTRFLVLELVEGQSLTRKLGGKPLAVTEAMDICLQVAEGLEAAHKEGVIHRDLKPSNIQVTTAGVAKVLDFGLARAMEEGDGSDSDWFNSLTDEADPTSTEPPSAQTSPGTILGTAAYMSPEQTRGETLDERSDIWSFGCVLFECLTGKRLFAGDTVSDSIGRILHTDPDWSALPADTPPTVQLLLRRCLTKDRKRRLQHIGDARVELEAAIADPSSSSLNLATLALAPKRSRVSTMLPWIATGVLAGLLALAAFSWPETVEPKVTRVPMALPEGQRFSWLGMPLLALSPGGRELVYAAGDNGPPQIWRQGCDQLVPTAMTRGRPGMSPFFSPRGDWMGYLSARRMMKMRVPSGDPTLVCATEDWLTSAAWGDGGNIVLNGDAVLYVVSADGGEPEKLTELDQEKDPHAEFVQPSFLPGGKVVMVGIRGEAATKDRVITIDLDSKEQKTILRGAVSARSPWDGYILYGRESRLLAAPFDHGTLEVGGGGIVVLTGVAFSRWRGVTQFDVSAGGSLAYVPSGVSDGNDGFDVQPVWVDHAGKITAASDRVKPGHYTDSRLSPDGKRLAVSMMVGDARTHRTRESSLGVIEIERGVVERLTFDLKHCHAPVWSPDGRYIAFGAGGRENTKNIYRIDLDGTRTPERLTTSENDQWPTSWSPDGKFLLFKERPDGQDRNKQNDTKMLRLDGAAPSVEDVWGTKFGELDPVFSPDGKWIAYASKQTASGKREVFIQPFPGPGRPVQVSTEGGRQPQWSQDGRAVLYMRSAESKTEVLSVQIDFGASAKPADPETRLRPAAGFAAWQDFSVGPDGKLLMLRQVGADASKVGAPVVVLNWLEELKKKVAAAKAK